MFGLVIRDVLFLKADEATRSAFEAEGSAPFTYTARGREVRTSHWRVPERLLDEPDEFAEWARTAVAAARRAETAKSLKAKKPAPKRKTAAPKARRG
jgi:DNA transformation protein